MKNIAMFLLICAFIGCSHSGFRTDEEMFECANKVYRGYLSEYLIDGSRFELQKFENSQNDSMVFRWTSLGPVGEVVGVEVVVSKKYGVKPSMKLIGDTKSWVPFVNSKPS